MRVAHDFTLVACRPLHSARLYSRRSTAKARASTSSPPPPRVTSRPALCCVCVIGSKSSTLSATKIGGSLGLVFIHERLRATVTALSRLHEVAETSEDAHDDDGADEETEDDVAKDVDIVLANVGLRLLDRRDGREERGKDECGLRGRGGGGGKGTRSSDAVSEGVGDEEWGGGPALRNG